MEIEPLLKERGTRYGKFSGHAQITQAFKRVARGASQWESLSDDKKEALEMIFHKIGRVLNGDPNWSDSWVDVSGYAQLVVDSLVEEK